MRSTAKSPAGKSPKKKSDKKPKPESPLVELCQIRDELAERLRVVSEAILLLVNPGPDAALLNARLTLEVERRKQALERPARNNKKAPARSKG
jgi:hypothetical protein